jgi:hypothetical protein
LENELAKYLQHQTNCNQEESVNALVIYYYCLQSNSSKELTEASKMKSNPFKDFCTKSREASFNLEKYTHIYTRLIKTATFQDPLFGATLLYYFLSQSNFSLENCLRGLMIYPIESLFIYVGFKLNSQYNQFNKTFNNNNNENTIEVVNNNTKNVIC